jgi:hypothetical protein
MAGGGKWRTMPAPPTTTVLAIPAGHRYVQRIRPDGYRFLPDPTEPWWPHQGLEPTHVRRIGREVDLVHLHFGFEHRTTAQLVTWLDTLDEFRLPLVVTAHDVRNPHLLDNRRHEEHLAVLLERASVVLTLTPCAAQELQLQWGREATVIAHPPLYASAPEAATERGLIGITLKARPSAFGLALLEPVLAAARRRGGRLQARFESGTEPFARRKGQGSPEGIEMVMVDHPPDDESFAAHIAQLAVAVLPYRFGTHSGWLEACRDLGTRVVAPSTGCYRDQWQEVLTYDPAPDRLRGSLEEAVTVALDLGPIAAPSSSSQQHRLDSVRAAHHEAYQLALTGVCA